MIFDHVSLSVSDLAHSRAFFSQALAPLDIAVAMEFPEAIGLGRGGQAELWLAAGNKQSSPLHMAFAAANRAQVDAFHQAALLAGGTDNGAPGLRSHYHADYYAAFVIGPDGHNVEAVCHHKPD